MEFKDINEFAKYYSKALLESPEIISGNNINKDTYKNSLGGELIHQFFTITEPTKVIGTLKNHKGFKWWTYGELISEFLNLGTPIMYKYKPEMFSKHYKLLVDGRMPYQYSSRWTEFNQLTNTYERLKQNPTSKRCVIPIFMPYDTAPDRADVPCTTMYHFIQRDGKLNMTVFMRSWDFFGGAKTYDFALSSFVLQALCSWLDLEPGKLSFYANSLHYYNRDKEQLKQLVEETRNNIIESNTLLLGKNTNILDFYEQLRKVKIIEEYAYSKNFEKAFELTKELNIPLFKDMAETWINKNIVGDRK